MNFSNDMIEKAKTAASVEELLKMAKENGVEMTAAEAQEYFNFLNANDPLSEDDLAQVAGGGKGESDPDPKPEYYIGQKVYMYDTKGNYHEGEITGSSYSKKQQVFYYSTKWYDGITVNPAPIGQKFCVVKIL